MAANPPPEYPTPTARSIAATNMIGIILRITLVYDSRKNPKPNGKTAAAPIVPINIAINITTGLTKHVSDSTRIRDHFVGKPSGIDT
jgi:hypothetical protein